MKPGLHVLHVPSLAQPLGQPTHVCAPWQVATTDVGNSERVIDDVTDGVSEGVIDSVADGVAPTDSDDVADADDVTVPVFEMDADTVDVGVVVGGVLPMY